MGAPGSHGDYDFDDQTWREDAACAGRTEVLWYPPLGERMDARMPDWTKQGRDICAGCPVQPPCLEHAIQAREAGLWGGLTELERISLRRQRAGGARCPDCPICGSEGVFSNNDKSRAICLADHHHRYGRDRVSRLWHA